MCLCKVIGLVVVWVGFGSLFVCLFPPVGPFLRFSIQSEISPPWACGRAPPSGQAGLRWLPNVNVRQNRLEARFPRVLGPHPECLSLGLTASSRVRGSPAVLLAAVPVLQ